MVKIRTALLVSLLWAGAGFSIGYSVSYSSGYYDALHDLKAKLDSMDEEQDTIHQTNPKWNI
jgi:hypothetical protein